MRPYSYILSCLMIFFCISAHAQTRKLVKEGNNLYQQKKYKEAAAAYQRALQKDPTYTPGLYNLGSSLYQQEQYEASRKAMEAAAKTSGTKENKAASQYNIGNSYMAEKKWQEAIDAYKQTLKNNPQDADAKYNLSYARQMMKQQQQNGGGDNNKDKKQDQDKKDENKKDGDKKDDQNKDQQPQDNKDNKEDKKEEQKPQPQPSKLSEKQAEQILNALQQEEKKLHDKKEKGQAVPIKIEKDW